MKKITNQRDVDGCVIKDAYLTDFVIETEDGMHESPLLLGRSQACPSVYEFYLQVDFYNGRWIESELEFPYHPSWLEESSYMKVFGGCLTHILEDIYNAFEEEY